jgi:predicted transcriptional regulator of viral defense system
VPLSDIDAKIINFVQVQHNGMVCADEVREFMGYKGNNAACARLNKLYKDGLLDRFQLGHKVYYKFDAGKTTNTLIISPPQ